MSQQYYDSRALGLYYPANDNIIIPVKHRIQLNNTGDEGYKECFDTSVTMCVDYLTKGRLTKEAKYKGFREPEDAWFTYRSKYGDTTDSTAQVRALNDIGIDAYFSTTASINDLMKSIYRGIPCVIGTKYKSSGHMVVVNGRHREGLRILCPNGIRDGSSNNWVTRFIQDSDAKPDEFSWKLVKQVFTDLGDEAGWCLFFTSVGGISTGVPKGL